MANKITQIAVFGWESVSIGFAMSIGAPRERQGRTSKLASWLVIGVVTSSSCVFDLPPLVEDSDPSGPDVPAPEPEPNLDAEPNPGPPPPEPTDTGTEGVEAGPEPEPTADTSMEPDPLEPAPDVSVPDTGGACGARQQECNGECIPLTGTCPIPCPKDCELPQAEAHCGEDGQCVIDQCLSNYVDCDGEWDNGCEVSFNFTPPATTPTTPIQDTPRIDAPLLDLDNPDAWDARELWPAESLWAIKEPCSGCSLSQPGLLPEQNPTYKGAGSSPNDLRGGFGLAWDITALYLHVQSQDEALLSGADTGLAEATGQDNVELVFDGDLNEVNGAEEQLLFISRTASSYDWPSDGNNFESRGGTVRIENVGSCQFLTARLPTRYLFDNSGASALSDGTDFAVDVGLNDFDFVPSTDSDAGGTTWDRQHQIFFRDPGDNYWFGDRRLVPLRLSDAERLGP